MLCNRKATGKAMRQLGEAKKLSPMRRISRRLKLMQAAVVLGPLYHFCDMHCHTSNTINTLRPCSFLCPYCTRCLLAVHQTNDTVGDAATMPWHRRNSGSILPIPFRHSASSPHLKGERLVLADYYLGLRRVTLRAGPALSYLPRMNTFRCRFRCEQCRPHGVVLSAFGMLISVL